MTHPNIDLPKITAQLEAIGFEAKTAIQFRRGFMDVRIVNGLVPDNIDFVPEVSFQVTVYGEGNEVSGVWHCPIDSFRFDE